jgi:hypothetical protein
MAHVDRVDAERSARSAGPESGELGRIATSIRASLDDVRRIARELRQQALLPALERSTKGARDPSVRDDQYGNLRVVRES